MPPTLVKITPDDPTAEVPALWVEFFDSCSAKAARSAKADIAILSIGIAIGILLYSIVYDYVKERELAQVRLEDSITDPWSQVMEPAPMYQYPTSNEKRSQAVLATVARSDT
ncbi:hypothetical protein EHS25_003274 [Saitozyma podzolica]|uniref:Uncharacterized protein n=1 Tax=Saitozyma podzolica TaxID=1890683 RepID=A0A427Y8I6_9TREE|nr:hypothetical protein EHS25_003274 [Saitozyma podzolica]